MFSLYLILELIIFLDLYRILINFYFFSIKEHENGQPKQKLEEDKNIRVHVEDFDENLLKNGKKLCKKHKSSMHFNGLKN